MCVLPRQSLFPSRREVSKSLVLLFVAFTAPSVWGMSRATVFAIVYTLQISVSKIGNKNKITA